MQVNIFKSKFLTFVISISLLNDVIMSHIYLNGSADDDNLDTVNSLLM